MRKHYDRIAGMMLSGAALLPALLLTGCGLDSIDDTERTVTYSVYNHITRLDGTGSVIATQGSYRLFFNVTQGWANITSTDLMYDNTKHMVSTIDMGYSGNAYVNPDMGIRGEVIRLDGGEGNVAAAGSSSVTSLSAVTSPFHNYVVTVTVPGYPVTGAGMSRLVMGYDYADTYRVRTFYPDNTFAGKTVTDWPDSEAAGGVATMEGENTIYRLVMDIEKGTADMIMYEPKFSDKMPPISALVLKGLTLTLTPSGYEVTGTGVIPEQLEAGATTPVEAFPFNSIRIVTTDSGMTQASIDFTVAGRFHGSFTGECIWTDSKAE